MITHSTRHLHLMYGKIVFIVLQFDTYNQAILGGGGGITYLVVTWLTVCTQVLSMRRGMHDTLLLLVALPCNIHLFTPVNTPFWNPGQVSSAAPQKWNEYTSIFLSPRKARPLLFRLSLLGVLRRGLSHCKAKRCAKRIQNMTAGFHKMECIFFMPHQLTTYHFMVTINQTYYVKIVEDTWTEEGENGTIMQQDKRVAESFELVHF